MGFVDTVSLIQLEMMLNVLFVLIRVMVLPFGDVTIRHVHQEPRVDPHHVLLVFPTIAMLITIHTTDVGLLVAERQEASKHQKNLQRPPKSASQQLTLRCCVVLIATFNAVGVHLGFFPLGPISFSVLAN